MYRTRIREFYVTPEVEVSETPEQAVICQSYSSNQPAEYPGQEW